MGQTHTIGRCSTTVKKYTDGTVVVQYHNTFVVTFNRHTITLDTGGYRTVTTKTRMNQTANQFNLGFCVFQKSFRWFVVIRKPDQPGQDWRSSNNPLPFDGGFFIIDRLTGTRWKGG